MADIISMAEASENFRKIREMQVKKDIQHIWKKISRIYEREEKLLLSLQKKE